MLVFQNHVTSLLHSLVSNDSSRAFEIWCMSLDGTVSPVTHEHVAIDIVLSETVFSSALQFELNLTVVCNFSLFID